MVAEILVWLLLSVLEASMAGKASQPVARRAW